MIGSVAQLQGRMNMNDYEWDEPDDSPEAFHADFEVPSAAYDTEPIIEVDEEHGLVRIAADDEHGDEEHIHKIANFIDYSVRKNHKQVGGSSGSLRCGWYVPAGRARWYVG